MSFSLSSYTCAGLESEKNQLNLQILFVSWPKQPWSHSHPAVGQQVAKKTNMPPAFIPNRDRESSSHTVSTLILDTRSQLFCSPSQDAPPAAHREGRQTIQLTKQKQLDGFRILIGIFLQLLFQFLGLFVLCACSRTHSFGLRKLKVLEDGNFDRSLLSSGRELGPTLIVLRSDFLAEGDWEGGAWAFLALLASFD